MQTKELQLLNSNRCSFLAAGFAVAAWAPMIPYVKERFALDEHQLGLLLLCVGIGSFISMPITGVLAGRFGCKKLIYASVLLLAFLIVAISVTSNLYLMAVILLCFGFSAVIVDVVSNINAALVEKELKRGVMSGLHGLYSVGGFCGSIIVTTLLNTWLGIVGSAIFAAVFVVIFTFAGGKHLFSSVGHNESKDNAITSKKFIFPHYLVIIVGLMCFVMFMTEGSVLDWSGVFLSSERGVDISMAGYGYSAFAIAMTVCRLTGDKIVMKMGRRRVLLLGSLCIFSGYCVVVYCPMAIASLCGFALIGVGASNIVPQLISYIASRKEMPMHLSVTWVNAIGFAGILCGPALIGFLAKVISLEYTFLCLACAVVAVGLGCFYLLAPKRAD